MTQQKRTLNNSLKLVGPLPNLVAQLGGRKATTLGKRASSNGTLATAKGLGSFPPGNRKFKDVVGPGNSSDFFRIDITENARLKLFLSNLSEGEISGAILNAAGKVVTANGKRQLINVAGGESANTLIRTATPGTYYLRVTNGTSDRSRYEVNLFVNRKGGPAPLPCGCGV